MGYPISITPTRSHAAANTVNVWRCLALVGPVR